MHTSVFWKKYEPIFAIYSEMHQKKDELMGVQREGGRIKQV